MPFDDGRERGDDVVREQQRVGEDDALDRRVRDVALVPERDVFEAGLQVRAQHPREPAQLLALHRVALVGHRARALLARAERLLDLAHLGALQVTDLERERLDARSDRRARVEQLGMAVARDHLRRGNRREPERRADEVLDRGIDVGVRADRARQLPDRDRVHGPATSRSRSRRICSAQSASLAPKVVGSAWMPCVRPTIGVSRNSCARAVTTASSASSASSSRSHAFTSWLHNAVSMTSHRGEPVVHPGAGGHARRVPGPRRRTRPCRGR